MSRYFRLVHRWAGLIDNVGPAAAQEAAALQYPPDAGVLATEILMHAQAGDPVALERVQNLYQYPRMRGLMRSINTRLRSQPQYGAFRSEAATMNASPRTGAWRHHHHYLIMIVQKNYGLPMTGILDPATVEALQHYQAGHGLPVTGTIDHATAHELMGNHRQPNIVHTGQGADPTDPRVLAMEARMQAPPPPPYLPMLPPWHDWRRFERDPYRRFHAGSFLHGLVDAFVPGAVFADLAHHDAPPPPGGWPPGDPRWHRDHPGFDPRLHHYGRFATGDAPADASTLPDAPAQVSPAAPVDGTPVAPGPDLASAPPAPPPAPQAVGPDGQPMRHHHHRMKHHRHRRWQGPGQPLAQVPPPQNLPPIDGVQTPDASQLPDDAPQPDPMGYYGVMNVPGPQAPPPPWGGAPWQRHWPAPGVPAFGPFREAYEPYREGYGYEAPRFAGPGPFPSRYAYGAIAPWHPAPPAPAFSPALGPSYGAPGAPRPFFGLPPAMNVPPRGQGLPLGANLPPARQLGAPRATMHPATAANILANPSLSHMHPAAAATIAATSSPATSHAILTSPAASTLHPAAAATLAAHATSPSAPGAPAASSTMHPATAATILANPSASAMHPAAAATIAATSSPATSHAILTSPAASTLHPAAAATLAAHATSTTSPSVPTTAPAATMHPTTAVAVLNNPAAKAAHPAAAASLATSHPAVSSNVLQTAAPGTIHPTAAAQLAQNVRQAPANKTTPDLGQPRATPSSTRSVALHPSVAANLASAHHAAGWAPRYGHPGFGHPGFGHAWGGRPPPAPLPFVPPAWSHGALSPEALRAPPPGATLAIEQQAMTGWRGGRGGFGRFGGHGFHHGYHHPMQPPPPPPPPPPDDYPPPPPPPPITGARFGSAHFGGYGRLGFGPRPMPAYHYPPYPVPSQGIPGSDYLFAEQDALDALPSPGGNDGPESWGVDASPYGTPGA